MAKRLSKTIAKVNRVTELNRMIDERGDEALDARRVKRGLVDTWVKRRSNNTAGCYKQHNAKPGACKVL